MVRIMSVKHFPVSEAQRDTLIELVSHHAFSGKERLATVSWLNSPRANYTDCTLLIDKARFRIDSKGGQR